MSGLTYTRNGRASFFADMFNAPNDPHAARRLARHAEEMRDVKGVQGQGAQGVIPPIWLDEAWASVARAPRAFADLVPKMALPPEGIDQVSVPQATTGPAVAVQASENSAVQETDIASAALTGNRVVSIAGQLDVSRQLFQRALPFVDEFVFADLAAAYDEKLDQQLIIGAGSGSGEHQGIDSLSGTIGVTYTQGTPDQATCLTNICYAVSKVFTQRKLGKGAKVAVIAHPRRLAWLSAASGTASLYDQPSFQELGLDVSFVADPSVPTNKGASTSEDRIYVVAYNDMRLAEGVQSLVMQDVLAGTGTVRLQLYSYSLWIPDRYVKGISVINGTGLVAPANF